MTEDCTHPEMYRQYRSTTVTELVTCQHCGTVIRQTQRAYNPAEIVVLIDHGVPTQAYLDGAS